MMMIKTSELRIGNYTSLGVVRTIYADEFLVVGDGGMYHSSEADIHPLPLTEARLLKFGFKPLVKDWQIKGLIIHTRKRGYVVNKKIQILEYVHQLQNLYYAHTGQELTINKP